MAILRDKKNAVLHGFLFSALVAACSVSLGPSEEGQTCSSVTPKAGAGARSRSVTARAWKRPSSEKPITVSSGLGSKRSIRQSPEREAASASSNAGPSSCTDAGASQCAAFPDSPYHRAHRGAAACKDRNLQPATDRFAKKSLCVLCALCVSVVKLLVVKL